MLTRSGAPHPCLRSAAGCSRAAAVPLGCRRAAESAGRSGCGPHTVTSRRFHMAAGILPAEAASLMLVPQAHCTGHGSNAYMHGQLGRARSTWFGYLARESLLPLSHFSQLSTSAEGRRYGGTRTGQPLGGVGGYSAGQYKGVFGGILTGRRRYPHPELGAELPGQHGQETTQHHTGKLKQQAMTTWTSAKGAGGGAGKP